jgi:4-hydroxy-tetrahydrodipicolinate reductase
MIKIIQIGLGPLGQKAVRFLLERPNLKLVAAVDPASDKVGKDVGELCGLKRLGVTVAPNLKSALRGRKADVAVLTTVSDLKRIEPQIAQIAAAGLPIVSTCEELSFSWNTSPAISRRIDAVCRKHDVACVGTGVNPGFLMDFLPSALSGVCQKVEKVRVQRIQDASARRVPFQQKIGAGLTLAQFRKKKEAGTLRHVGLTESMHMIAHGLGWKLSKTTETLKPVLAKSRITDGYRPIEPGMARGVEQIGRAFVGGREVITLEFRAAVDEPKSFDAVEITGAPNLTSVIEGGVNGDIATCAVVLNTVAAIRKVAPGLKTMLDLPVVTCQGS